jgi:ribosomal protein S17E
MGKIKPKSVKRAAQVLVESGVEFEDSFEKNKKVLEGVAPSKKLRNQMAGLLTKMKKKQLEAKAKK